MVSFVSIILKKSFVIGSKLLMSLFFNRTKLDTTLLEPMFTDLICSHCAGVKKIFEYKYVF